MAIIVKDYEWRQTVTTVTIQVPLHSVQQSKLDVFTSPNYIKASYSPYFFDALLSHPIDSTKSICTVTSSEVVFELRKEEERRWETLEVELSRKERNELKKKYMEEEYRRLQQELNTKFARKCELKKVAVKEQILADTRKREFIDSVKKEEKERALGNINEWRKTLKQEPKIIQLKENVERTCKIKDTQVHVKPSKKHNLKSAKNKINIPPPRATNTVVVDFTERVFPTPCRETRLEEENEWLAKQVEARRSVGFVSEDLKPEEKNPQYLKAKGDEFMRVGNYLGAISAYSFGIKLSVNYVDLYIKRSEAQFAIGNLKRTIEDCSKALELMKPEVSANFLDRITCIVRRGKALFKFGLKTQGFNEVEIAYRMQPGNEELKQLLIDFMDELNNPVEKDDGPLNGDVEMSKKNEN